MSKPKVFLTRKWPRKAEEALGEIVTAIDLLRNKQIDVEIVSPHFVDPEGEKLRA